MMHVCSTCEKVGGREKPFTVGKTHLFFPTQYCVFPTQIGGDFEHTCLKAKSVAQTFYAKQLKRNGLKNRSIKANDMRYPGVCQSEKYRELRPISVHFNFSCFAVRHCFFWDVAMSRVGAKFELVRLRVACGVFKIKLNMHACTRLTASVHQLLREECKGSHWKSFHKGILKHDDLSAM